MFHRIVSSISAIAILTLVVAADVGLGKAWAADPEQPLRVQSFDRVAEEKAPWGSLRWLMNGKLDPQSTITLGVVEIHSGQSNPLHVHANCEEVIYVLSGTCEHRVGKQTVVLKAGDVLHIPAGVPHAAKVLGNQPMRSVVVYNSGQRQFAVVPEKKDAAPPAGKSP